MAVKSPIFQKTPDDKIKWSRRGGYECSSKGDTRFSAFYAKMPDGRSIECWYQCDIKGHDIGGTNWRVGKGKPPAIHYPGDQQWELYLSLWRLWALHHIPWMQELLEKVKAHDNTLSDCFANTDNNQARALAQILNEWFI